MRQHFPAGALFGLLLAGCAHPASASDTVQAVAAGRTDRPAPVRIVDGVGLYPVGTPGLSVAERRARNLYIARRAIEGYRIAYKTQSFPPVPDEEASLFAWAPGATMQIGASPVLPVQHADAESGRQFGEVEAMVFWRGTPDWRITDYHLAGDETVVIAATKYEGTMKDGSKPFTWITDIYYFDDEGRQTRWIEPHSDNGVQEAWIRQGGYPNYLAGLIAELKLRGLPLPAGLEQAMAAMAAQAAAAQ